MNKCPKCTAEAVANEPRKCYTPQQEALFELVIAVELLLMGFMDGRFTVFAGV